MKALRENLLERALALVLAVLMWASARELQHPEQLRLKLDLEWRDKPEALVVVRGLKQVRFVLRGSRKELRRATPRTLAPYVDLSKAQPGKGSFDVIYGLSGSADLQQIEVIPPRAEFEFEKLVTRRFPIRLDLAGSPREGYEIGERAISPTHVSVSGRESLVSRVAAARVEVDASDPESALRVAPVELLSRSVSPVRGLATDPKQVRVALSFAEQERQVDDVPIRPQTRGRVAAGAELETVRLNPATIALTGRVDLLRKVIDVKTEVIDLTGLRETTERRVRLMVPDELHANGSATTVATIVVRPPKPDKGAGDEGGAPSGGKGTGKAPAKPADKGESGETHGGTGDDSPPPPGGGGE